MCQNIIFFKKSLVLDHIQKIKLILSTIIEMESLIPDKS